MHELSIVMSIIDIAEQQAKKAKALAIEEIELDIGCLTTVEMNAFEMAWQQGIKGSLLEQAVKTVNRIPGKAACSHCNTTFPMQQHFDPCPVCGSHLVAVLEGKELRVRSLVVT